MTRRPNYLDADENAFEQNLRFVNNDVEDNINQYFGGMDGKPSSSTNISAPPRDYKLVTPMPGCCIKSFKVNTNEKYFINVCQSEEIPAPEDITEEQLAQILESDAPSSYRVPMSIADPRIVKDKSNNPVDACDIAINPQFFAKINKSKLFRDFYLALIAEALSDKYNVQIDIRKAVILANRKFIGTLVEHRVRTADIKKAIRSTEADIENISKLLSSAPGGGNNRSKRKPMVQEVAASEAEKLKQMAEELNKQISARGKHEISVTVPDFKLRAKLRNEKVDELQAEFFLPKCITSRDFNLDVGEDRIFLESMHCGYLFDKFVNYRLKQECAKAIFDKTNKMLQVRIPVFPVD